MCECVFSRALSLCVYNFRQWWKNRSLRTLWKAKERRGEERRGEERPTSINVHFDSNWVDTGREGCIPLRLQLPRRRQGTEGGRDGPVGEIKDVWINVKELLQMDREKQTENEK